ncbi:DoxX family protein [Muricauda sp. 2012CJ35-5]|uniref:DoxX family protein n=1 Tax=Flagellimonas spongiicola TaxID=2942208 RepID=A0ABT0PT66_9FLAO|nr:DoxX family protein [Allomuricauda spongiicola]MCL6274166.1 DoxX family protein [Allomuricauda spongiicola]
MKLRSIAFWLSTSLLTLMMCFSVYNYFFNNEAIVGFFQNMGYPVYLIYPLAIAKILGLVAIWGNFSKWLKEWAYAGFFFNTVLAFFAHYMISDGQHMGAALACVFVLTSYFTGKTVRP